MPALRTIVQEPRLPATAAVIWMHGLGATFHDFESVPPVLGLPADLPIRFVFPQAPSQAVTINGGYVMPAWYDILSLEIGQTGRREDEEGIRRSGRLIDELIDAQIGKGIATERIVLAGFSQGGAMALHTALRFPARLGGIVALSCYLPLARHFDADLQAAQQALPIFMAHGRYDPVVPVVAAEHSRDFLTEKGFDVTWKAYSMEHQVCTEELEAIGDFLKRVLS